MRRVVKTSKPSAEVEDKSDNSTAASSLYQLQKDLQQQQRQQQFEGMQQFLASFNANSMPSLLSQNLPLLPPPISQVAAGEMENYVFIYVTRFRRHSKFKWKYGMRTAANATKTAATASCNYFTAQCSKF